MPVDDDAVLASKYAVASAELEEIFDPNRPPPPPLITRVNVTIEEHAAMLDGNPSFTIRCHQLSE